jgi:hypothetical protein
MAKSELEKKLEALPDNPRAVRKWTMEQDSMLIKFGPTKGFQALARVLGIPGDACRKRYHLLTEKMKQ